jgi:hypothetical protein
VGRVGGPRGNGVSVVAGSWVRWSITEDSVEKKANP